MNRQQRRANVRVAKKIGIVEVEAHGAYLQYWPSEDAAGKGLTGNGTCRYYSHNGIRAHVERSDAGNPMLTLFGPGRDLTLAEIYHARASLWPEVEYMMLILAREPDNGYMVCVQGTGSESADKSLILVPR